MSFSRRRKPLLKSITETNEELWDFLRRQSYIMNESSTGYRALPRDNRPTARDIESLRNLQGLVWDLNRALRKTWLECSCGQNHRCGIVAAWDRSISGPTSNLSLLIGSQDPMKRINVEQASWSRTEQDLGETSGPSRIEHIHDTQVRFNQPDKAIENSKFAKDRRTAVMTALGGISLALKGTTPEPETLLRNPPHRKLQKKASAGHTQSYVDHQST